MEPLQQRQLSELRIEVISLLRQIKSQRNVYHSAGQEVSRFEIGQAQQNACGVSSANIAGELSLARKSMAIAAQNIQKIKERLIAIADELNRRLKQWDDALWQFKNDPKKLREVKFVAKSYEEAQDIAQREKWKIRAILKLIHQALSSAQQVMSGTLVHSNKTQHLDDILTDTKTTRPFQTNIKYVPLSVTYATVDHLDSEIYRHSSYPIATDYISPQPNLGKYTTYGSSVKLDTAGNYLPKTYYPAQLANHQLLQGEYLSRTGVYST